MKPIVRIAFYGCSTVVERKLAAEFIKVARAAHVGRVTRTISVKRASSGSKAVVATYVKIIADAGVDRVRFVYTK